MRVLAFDIETADADQLHSYGPGFVRLCGWQRLDISGHPITPIRTDTSAALLVAEIAEAERITAHNGINFDLMALAKYHGLDYEAACAKTFDTLVVEKHLSPVAAKGAQPNGFYKLGAVAERYGVSGKDTVDFDGKVAVYRRVKGDRYADTMARNRLKAAEKARAAGKEPAEFRETSMLDVLKDVYGGYDQIPVDDPDYVRYLVKDVAAQAAVYREQMSALRREEQSSLLYVKREHYVSASMGRVTLEGARVDTDLTMRRWSEGQARLEASKQRLHEQHGMPLEGKKPHTTNEGKAAFRNALIATGISERALKLNWPHNKDGSLSTAKDTLNSMIESLDKFGRTEAAELCRTIMAMNGERTVYGTVLAHLVNGRVHPYIGPDQASGRWSMKDPGLTVLGKRGGKARERAMILADEGDVLVAIDADQIDARMIAALSQDPEYMALFGPGIDLHSEVAYRVWADMALHGSDCHLETKPGCGCGVVRKCHCVLRDRAKVFGHGWNYGMGWRTMVRQHGVAEEVAQQFCDGMAAAFPVLVEWQNRMRELAGAVGFDEEVPANDSYRILHTAFGRPVRVERNRAFTQACALIGQGSTRDGMAEAVLNLPPQHRRRIRAIVHDEIVVSIPDGPDAQQRAQAIADSMGFDFYGIRISFGCSRVAKSWAGCYGEQYEEAA
jgi:DNA polymerase-1